MCIGISRMDRLPAGEQLLLKVASVMGMGFTIPELIYLAAKAGATGTHVDGQEGRRSDIVKDQKRARSH